MSWLHLDDVKTVSSCSYCDHSHDVTPQLRDRDWRYKRSGIFGRDDNQLGGVPVALTLQQLSTSLHDGVLMYSTAMNFRPDGADIEPCESDFVAVVAGRIFVVEQPDNNPVPAAAPVIPRAVIKCLRFSARSAAIFLSFPTVAAESRISISLLAIMWASLPVGV